MKYAIKLCVATTCAILLTSCGSFDGVKDTGRPQSASGPMSASQGQVANPDQPSKLGSPFVVGNKTYTPEDVVSYDDVGYASFYGQELAGRPTANGEVFMPSGITAAHKTLPMPTYVEVTALDTGRTILVRVNDRGPFANDRLIDLSEGAARQLGILDQGVAGVRVRKVNPPEQERAVLRAGSEAAARIDTPESLLRVLRDKLAKMPRPSSVAQAPISAPVTTARPTQRPPVSRPPESRPSGNSSDGRFIREGAGAARPSPVQTQAPEAAPANGRRPIIIEREGATQKAEGIYVVQIAAFGDRNRANALARKLGARVATSGDGRTFRVQYGPYASEEEAQRGLATAKQRGYPQARLFKQ
jgi:rare lipoprotein A